MDKLAKFIEENEVESSNSLIGEKKLLEIEEIVGVKIGDCLAEYILNYGYLIYSSVELYGVTARQGVSSDMVKQTIYLHTYFEKTKGYIALENQGDGDYYLIDNNDQIFEFDSELNELIETNLGLEEYILNRFNGEDK